MSAIGQLIAALIYGAASIVIALGVWRLSFPAPSRADDAALVVCLLAIATYCFGTAARRGSYRAPQD